MEHQHHIHSLMSANPFALLGFISILGFSFFSSLHCTLMCGPIVCAKLGVNSHFKSLQIWIYNAARVGSYSIFGYILGAVGDGISLMSADLSQALAWLVFIFLCWRALIKIANLFHTGFLNRVLNSAEGLLWPPQLQVKILKFLSPKSLHKLKSENTQSFILGLITVFLPCMTLTPALGMALMSGSATFGGLFMFAFALGTLPAMILTPTLAGAVLRKAPLKLATALSLLFYILALIFTFLRAFEIQH